MANNEYKTVSLFNDIEDVSLRNRNRAVILTNELERGFVKGKLTAKAAAFIMGYFSQIPKADQKEVKEKFVDFANERGFVIE